MRWSWAVLGALALAGCASKPLPPKCIQVDTSCAALYPPIFDCVYKDTLTKSCGSTNGSCHSDAGRMGGMTFQADEATAYSELLATAKIDPSRKRVVPGDPSCSLLIVRTDSVGASYQMPRGTPLSAEERCALLQWVQAGAPGPGEACP